MAKKLVAIVKIQLMAGKATPAPPVGPALGQHGINIMGFVKEYNAKTADKVGSVVPAEVTIYSDRSFNLRLLTPPAADLIRKAAGVPRGSAMAARTMVGKLTWKQVQEIAQEKMPDLNTDDMEQAKKIIAGTARSMGIRVVDE
ncbi:MAG: 50S ribosomal protein L11 [Chloroflexaceae bacterium]|nr:50S ribosomal protein L11 [Chloroflexaceae bacterium]NJO04881.1 50S ribosomal protein L11 [Chloroflexaceae bacterium]